MCKTPSCHLFHRLRINSIGRNPCPNSYRAVPNPLSTMPMPFSSDIPSICHQHWLLTSKQNMLELGDLGGEKLYAWQGNRTYPSSLQQSFEASDTATVNEAFNLSGDARNQPTIGLRAAGAKLPSLVVLSSWEKSYERASNELQKWIMLGEGAVQVAILLAWNIVAQSIMDCRVKVIVPDTNETSLIRVVMQEVGESHMIRKFELKQLEIHDPQSGPRATIN